MRLFLLAPLALLAACAGSSDPNAPQGNGAAAPPPGQPDNRIECRPAGAAAFERACTVDGVDSPRGRVLTIRKADGGFRRLLVASDGRISAADGAQAAHIVWRGAGATEVEIGGDHFRLPARPL
jgi:hypothetical protein